MSVARVVAVITALASAASAQPAPYVIPPVVVSGWTAPPGPDGATPVLTNRTAGVTARGATIATTARTPVTARVTAAGAGTFTVTVLPAAGARYVVAYTRAPLEPHRYAPVLAHSVHLALGDTPAAARPLNEGYGVLFARAVPTARLDVNAPRALAEPWVFYRKDGTFGVVATRTLPNGGADSAAASSVLYFTSPDLRTFTEVGLVPLGAEGGVHRPRAIYDSARDRYLVAWTDDAGRPHHVAFAALDRPETRSAVRDGAPAFDSVAASIDGASASSVLPVSAAVARGLTVRFGRVVNVGVRVPEITVRAGDTLALRRVRATLAYSDGSTAERAIDWDAADLRALARPGRHRVAGTVRQRTYPFPFVAARADPSVVAYRGRYYFIATDDTDGGNVRAGRMFVRAADSVLALRSAPDHTVLTTGPAGIAGCFWAPELHDVAGVLHVFFAPCVGEASWKRVQAHVMALRPGGDPTRAEDWGPPRPVVQCDGAPLQLDAAHPGISLDMTYFAAGGRSYVAWSQRYIVGDAIGDAEIWVATVNPADPSRLTSAPRRLVTAEYGWDHNQAAVAEGPFVVRRGGAVYMTYSGSAVGPTYVTGLLTAPAGADLTRAASWTKLGYPVLKTDTTIGQWGPGHNSFSTDEDGDLLVVYHAKSAPNTRDRHAAVRRVHWAADGMPVLDMTPDEEVAPAFRRVVATVVVRGPR